MKQLVHRVTRTITDCGIKDGYFADKESAEIFYNELTWLCVNQHGEEVLSGEAWVMPSTARVVYDEGAPRAGSLVTWALSPWAVAAHAMRLWAIAVTSAVRR